MKEVVQVKLENEMDLILAHKRTMKLCELTGFSLIVQTTIATAVSEIARCAIEHGKNADMILGMEVTSGKKYLKIIIRDTGNFTLKSGDAYNYAKKLVDDIETVKTARDTQVHLRQQLAFGGILTDAKIDSFIEYFRNEPPMSPYDELRRKNVLLQEMAEKIKESENDYRILTDSLPLMIFSVNNRGNITYTNKGVQDFFGGAPKDITPAGWQSFLHISDFTSFAKELTNAVQRQQPFNGQFRFKHKGTGNFHWHLISVIPLKNEKDIIIRWIGFLVDIQAQKQMEQTLKDNRELKETQAELYNNQAELQRKVVELNRSNYELEQFAHLASHDLQEPLRKLFFYSDVLKRKYGEVLDAPGANMLNNMTLAASRMKELINDLLNYSQLQQQTLQFEEVNLNDILAEIQKDLDVVIREKQAVVEVANLPVITGNSIRLRQLFSNLISNALKYSKTGVPPVIQIGVHQSNDEVTIQVRDNGIGFEDQYSEKIFGLFERLHTRDKYPGTGIGLSICKRIAELHVGQIRATSKINEYSIFEVKLPATQPVAVEQ